MWRAYSYVTSPYVNKGVFYASLLYFGHKSIRYADAVKLEGHNSLFGGKTWGITSRHLYEERIDGPFEGGVTNMPI